MIQYEDAVKKAYEKGKLPRLIFEQFHNAFQSLELTKDYGLFDIKALKGKANEGRVYFRLRKGKYRAIFFVEKENYFVVSIAKRDEVYKKWQ